MQNLKEWRKKGMNKKVKEYNLIQSIYYQDRNKEGYCKYYPNNTDIHEDTKWAIFKKLKKLGFKAWSETRIKGGRADICVISPDSKGFILEIMESEPESSYLRKLNEYDLLWEIIPIKVKGFDISTFEL